MFTGVILLCNGLGFNDCYHITSVTFFESEQACMQSVVDLVSDPMFKDRFVAQIEGKYFTIRDVYCIDWTDKKV